MAATGHRICTDLGMAARGGANVISDPGSAGTLNLEGKSMGICLADANGSASDERYLPTAAQDLLGTVVFITSYDNTGGAEDIVVKTASGGTTLATVANAETGMFVCGMTTTGTYSWHAVVLKVGAT